MRRPDELRSANAFRLVEAVIRSAPLTRAELCARTGLATGTVSEVTSALLARGYLVIDSVERTKGRPLERVSFNRDALLLGGVYPTNPAQLQLLITDATGEVLHTAAVDFRPATGPGVATQLAELLERLLGETPEPLRRLSALAIAFPGLVDTRNGLVHWAGVPLDPPLALADMLRELLGFPVFLENLVTAWARAERLYGDGRDVENFAVVTPGLGLGQYVRGEPWMGPRGVNPEFRHFKVATSGGRKCDCGAEGCLGPYAGRWHIAREACELIGAPPPALGTLAVAFDHILDRLEDGDARIAALFQRAGSLLGLALANIVNLFDPERIIVTGPSERFLEALRPPLEEALTANTFPRGRAPDLKLKVDDWALSGKGAAAFALERIVMSGEGGR